MNIQNIHNQQNYTPNFKANLVNNYPLKGLLVSAIDNPKYKEPLKKEILKLKDIYPNTVIEFTKRQTVNGNDIPVIKNLTNGNMISGLDLYRKGFKNFLDNSYRLFQRLNETACEEHFLLFQQKGIRARNNNRAIIAQLQEQSEKIHIKDGILDAETSSLMDKFLTSVLFDQKTANITHSKHDNSMQILLSNNMPVYDFTIIDKNNEKTSKAFRIKKSHNMYFIKRNDFMNREEILDVLKDYLTEFSKHKELTNINDGYLEGTTLSLMNLFESTAKFASKKFVKFHHRKYKGHIKISRENDLPSYIFSLYDENNQKTLKTFRIIKDKDSYYIKRNDYMDKEEIVNILQEYIPKYLKLNKHSNSLI